MLFLLILVFLYNNVNCMLQICMKFTKNILKNLKNTGKVVVKWNFFMYYDYVSYFVFPYYTPG